MLACFRGNDEVIKLLLKGGAGTHSRDRVRKTLNCLQFVHDISFVLLSFFQWGKTALMYAVQRGHVEVVKMLLKNHADAAARDNDGRSVEGFARPGTLSFDTLVNLLRESLKEFEERYVDIHIAA